MQYLSVRFRQLGFIMLVLAVNGLTSCSEAQKGNNIPQESRGAPLKQVEEYVFSTIVSQNGHIVYEQYYNGKTRDSLCHVQSLTKGLISILLGIAVEQGYLKSLDEPIAGYFPLAFQTLSDKRKRRITLKHLLNQTSGLVWKGYLAHDNWLNSEDPVLYVLGKEITHDPGEAYNYNSGATHLLSIIISKATGKSTLEFAQEVLFNPLNIKEVDWELRKGGHYDGSGLGLSMKPLDLMKIGQLLENHGKWNGETLVSRTWVEQLFEDKEKSKTTWGLRNSKHGYCWYKAELNGDTIDYGMGYGGQFILLIPAKKLVIVTTHRHDTPNGIEQQIGFLTKKLPVLIEKFGI